MKIKVLSCDLVQIFIVSLLKNSLIVSLSIQSLETGRLVIVSNLNGYEERKEENEISKQASRNKIKPTSPHKKLSIPEPVYSQLLFSPMIFRRNPLSPHCWYRITK